MRMNSEPRAPKDERRASVGRAAIVIHVAGVDHTLARLKRSTLLRCEYPILAATG